jgi:S-adenosylmethionine decarboxylase
MSHQFSPYGVTAIALLAESHISIHTWSEAGYAAIDVFTCGNVAKPEIACSYLIDALQAGNYYLQTIDRSTFSSTVT